MVIIVGVVEVISVVGVVVAGPVDGDVGVIDAKLRPLIEAVLFL